MISTIIQRIEYGGDGATVGFAVPWRYDDKAWVKIYVDDILQLLNTDYTLTAPGATGTAIMTTAPADGTNLIIVRSTPITNLTQLPAEGPFLSVTIERLMIDKLVMILQDLKEELARCIKFPVTSLYNDIPLPDPEAGKLLSWASALDALINSAVGSLSLGDTPVVVVSVLATEVTVAVPHGLGSAGAKLIGISTTWHTTVKIVSMTALVANLEFGSQAPTGGGTVTAEFTL